MKLSGIYMIQSKCKPERIYVGSSVDIKSRWRIHKYNLRYKKHGNPKLQNHVNKYGINDLKFKILSGSDESGLIDLEQYFIDSHKCWFNIRNDAKSNFGLRHTEESKTKMRHPLSEETKRRMSESRKGRSSGMLGKHHSEESKRKSSKSHKGQNNWSGKALIQYDREGNFIRNYDSSLQAEKETGVHSGNIRHCLVGIYKQSGGFIWKYKNAS